MLLVVITACNTIRPIHMQSQIVIRPTLPAFPTSMPHSMAGLTTVTMAAGSLVAALPTASVTTAGVAVALSTVGMANALNSDAGRTASILAALGMSNSSMVPSFYQGMCHLK